MGQSRIELAQSFFDNVILLHKIRLSIVDKYVIAKTDSLDKNHFAIYDLSTYTQIFLLDFLVVSKHLVVCKECNEEYEVNYFARALSVHLTQILQNTGEGFRTRLKSVIYIYRNVDEHKETVEKLGKFMDEMKRLSKEHLLFITDIRNNLIAHIESDGIRQREKMLQIDITKLLEIGTAIYDILSELNRYLFDLFGVFKTVKEGHATLSSFFNSFYFHPLNTNVKSN